MRRRTLLALAGPSLPLVSGCVSSSGDAGTNGSPTGADTDASPSATPTDAPTTADRDTTPDPGETTCDDPKFGAATEVTGTPVTSVKGNRTGVRYDVSADNDGDSAETVAIRVAERTDRECDPLVFDAVYRLEPGAETVIRRPIGGAGEYLLIVNVRDGETVSREITTVGGGISSARAYFVSVTGGSVDVHSVTR